MAAPRFKSFSRRKNINFCGETLHGGRRFLLILAPRFLGKTMRRIQQLLPPILALGLCLALAGCYSDQKKQLAQCEASATRTGNGQPLKSIRSCMDENGYRFVGFANTMAETVQCDLPAIIQGKPSETGTDALCFEPKSWIGLRLYRWEVPVRHVAANTDSQ
jgi:hypothetical protein